jgi:autotransporter adhesin
VTSLDLNSQRIINLANPVSGNDAMNKATADNSYYANTVTLNNITLADGQVSLNSHKIVNLADGVGTNDAVNRSQLDAVADNAYTKTQADNRYY